MNGKVHPLTGGLKKPRGWVETMTVVKRKRLLPFRKNVAATARFAVIYKLSYKRELIASYIRVLN